MYSPSWGLTTIMAVHLKLQFCPFAPTKDWKYPRFSGNVALAKWSIIVFIISDFRSQNCGIRLIETIRHFHYLILSEGQKRIVSVNASPLLMHLPLGIWNGKSKKPVRLAKYPPSLDFSDLKTKVSESRARKNFNRLEISNLSIKLSVVDES